MAEISKIQSKWLKFSIWKQDGDLPEKIRGKVQLGLCKTVDLPGVYEDTIKAVRRKKVICFI